MWDDEVKEQKLKTFFQFRKLPPNYDINLIKIPEIVENRHCTDVVFLVFLVLLFVVTLPFVGYTLSHASIHRWFTSFDSCGDMCGQKNAKYEALTCSGHDYRNKKYLEVDTRNGTALTLVDSSRTCVSHCSEGYQQVYTFCLKAEQDPEQYLHHHLYLNEARLYLKSVSWRIAIVCVLSAGVTWYALLILRMSTNCMVWFSIVTFSVGFTTFSLISWFYFATATNKFARWTLLALSIVLTLMTIVLICVIVFLRHKIRLSILLLKEAMRAMQAMGTMQGVTLTILLIELGILISFIACIGYMFAAGNMKQDGDNVILQRDHYMITSIVLYVVLTFWFLQFLDGLLYMIIAGAVSKWYFAKDKSTIVYPVLTSAVVAIAFHLGTIAFGSLMLVFVMFIRKTVLVACRNRVGKCIVKCCSSCIKGLLMYFSKSAYAVTAFHGRGLYKSGRRAYLLIMKNKMNLIAMKLVAKFVLSLTALSIMTITVALTRLCLVGTNLHLMFLALIVVIIITGFVTTVYMALIKCVIDTIFICFCEDLMINDGQARPYAMSTELSEFMTSAKSLFKLKGNVE